MKRFISNSIFFTLLILITSCKPRKPYYLFENSAHIYIRPGTPERIKLFSDADTSIVPFIPAKSDVLQVEKSLSSCYEIDMDNLFSDSTLEKKFSKTHFSRHIRRYSGIDENKRVIKIDLFVDENLSHPSNAILSEHYEIPRSGGCLFVSGHIFLGSNKCYLSCQVKN